MKSLRWIKNNIDLKIWSVVIALIVWFHVATDRTYDTTYTADLEFVNPPKGWTVVGEPPKQISLILRGTGKQLMSHRIYGEPSATVGLPDIKSLRVPIDLASEDVVLARKGNLEIIRVVSPTHVDIEMDALARKKIPLEPDIVGEPRRDFTMVGRPALIPNEVELSGGRNRIRRIVELKTEPIDIQGEAGSLERTVAVSLPEGAGFRSRPDSVRARVVIDKIGERVLEKLPIEITNLESSKSATISPRIATVRVAGPESMMDKLDSALVSISVDLSDVSEGDHLIPPKTTTPDGFAVVSVNPELIRVNIE